MLRKRLCLLLACAISIYCLSVTAIAATSLEEGGKRNAETVMRATNSFTVEIKAYDNANAKTSFPMEAGETVRIWGTYAPADASVDFGLIDEDGIFHYLNTKTGVFDETFEISKRGQYRLGIRNNSGKVVKISGFVRY